MGGTSVDTAGVASSSVNRSKPAGAWRVRNRQDGAGRSGSVRVVLAVTVRVVVVMPAPGR